jgi:AraC family transcriptional regulator
MSEPAPLGLRNEAAARLFPYCRSHVILPECEVHVFTQLPPAELELPPMQDHAVMYMLAPQHNSYEERGGQRYQGGSQRGDLTLVPAGLASRWIWRQPASLLNVEINPTLLTRSAEELGRGGRVPEIRNRFRMRDPEIERICLALLAELRTGGPGGRLYVESLAHQMAVCLLRRHSDVALAADANPGLPRNRLQRVMDYIEANLNNGVRLQELASLAGLSPFHFARQFKDATGLAPHQFLLRSRVERAKQLLERTELSLAEIGLTLGFSHQSHFTNVFRRMVGATPKAWREAQNPAIS